MSNSQTNESSKRFQSWRNFLIWLILALLLRWQVMEPRWIPSGSMLPTLQIHDKILIEKIRPRLTLSTHNHLDKNTLIVFAPPEALVEAGYEKNSALIKRVIGLPGDQIEVHEGKLFLNEKLIEEPWVAEPIKYKMGPIIVPEDSLWVLGDNRNNSLDSHIWGPLPERNVIGTAFLRYWPLGKFGFIRETTPGQYER
ncbi:signal peptidase I [Prochlorococcus sp. MIT 1223]|uniref:signal peptidase I n=1 Tax=Prochlorococcus sp. MIT 1223 TaxID=3096217 RepID=UPI002A758B57|nr:signal peptidase I [Prochlorococcus sp. MIT 1223]